MMIRPKRLLALLVESGFELERYEPDVKLLAFSRPSPFDQVIEVLRFHFGGRRGEIAPCDLRLSVVRDAISVVDLSDRRMFTDIAEHKDQGVTELHTAADGEAWERLVAAHAPQALRKYAIDGGVALLERTKANRELAKSYVKIACGSCDLDSLPSSLERKLSARERDSALRMARTPGVQWIENGEEIYQTACKVLCAYASAVEPSTVERLLSANPLEEKDVNQRIQLIVHYLFGNDLVLRPGYGRLIAAGI